MNEFTVTIAHDHHGSRKVRLFQNRAIGSQAEAERYVFRKYARRGWRVLWSN